MADAKITALTANTTPAIADLLAIVDDPAGVPATQKITLENLLKVINGLTADASPDTSADYVVTYDASAGAAKKVLLNLLGGGVTSGPQAFGDNYVITPSVASNNLTVALKTIAGADPSSSDKITVRIGNTKREITAALSVTKNAATNWCNAGSAELAANPIDFFVYVIQETGAGAGTKIGFSRIPYAKTMNDFVNTTTSEKYIAGSWTNFNATDQVEVIGRFRAQLSAGAGYNWSIASALVVNRPIYETDELNFTPAWSASGSLTYTTVTSQIKSYKISGNKIFVHGRGSGTLGGSASNVIFFTTPFTPNYTTNSQNIGWILFSDGSAAPGTFGGAYYDISASKIANVKYNNANWHTSGTGIVDSVCEYLI